MNILIDIIPAAARRYVYAALTLAALVWSVYQASGGDWRQFVGGLIVALTTATATANTELGKLPDDQYPAGYAAAVEAHEEELESGDEPS